MVVKIQRSRKRAFSYIRFSDRKQAKGDSLRRQLEWGQQLCQVKGWDLDTELKLHDLGKSAFRGRNAITGTLGAFLQAIKQGKVQPGDVLLVESLDRLSRDDIDPAWELFRSILKAGVEIVTREPERHYLPEKLNDFGTRIEVMAYMLRAHNESATKSMRGCDYWKAKRAQLCELKPIHKVLPAWLRLSSDRQRVEVIPEAVKAVQLIYQWAGEGLGLNPITARLNEKGITPIGNNTRRKVFKGSWCRSYVAKLLQEKAVLGEFQPHVMKDGKRVPQGEAVKGYFPQIISEQEWYSVRQAVKERGRNRGRTGVLVASIFTGLIRDARDGQVMHLTYAGSSRKNNTRTLLSYGARNGLPGSERLPFPYDGFEETFLTLIKELSATDLVTGKAEERGLELAALLGKREELMEKIEKIQARLVGEKSIDALIPVLEQLEMELKAIDATLEKLKGEEAHNRPAALGEAQSLAGLLREAKESERTELRFKMRAKIKQLVSEIWMLVWDATPNIRAAEVQVFFHTGQVRGFFLRWFRRGRHRGHVAAGGGQTLVRSGEPMVLDDLRLYRSEPSLREAYARKMADYLPLILKYEKAQDAAVAAAKKVEEGLGYEGVVDQVEEIYILPNDE